MYSGWGRPPSVEVTESAVNLRMPRNGQRSAQAPMGHEHPRRLAYQSNALRIVRVVIEPSTTTRRKGPSTTVRVSSLNSKICTGADRP